MLDDDRRLADLLREPRETLDIEIKDWLDLGDRHHKAVLAKAAIALANHGGGFIVIGFTRAGDSFLPGAGRPESLGAFNQDAINGIVSHYTEPPFHCDLRIVIQPGTDVAFPVVVVPGGHRVPIRSKRAGPDGQGLQKNVYYIRRPGPQSESPQSAKEWDDLVHRCVRAGREDLLSSIRDILSGRVSEDAASGQEHMLANWAEDSVSRWRKSIEKLPPESPARCPHGFWWVTYAITELTKPRSAVDLLEIMSDKRSRQTGWPPWWVPTREGIRPYSQGDGIECWLGGDPEKRTRDPATSDFWRASPRGLFFLLRGYEEDAASIDPDEPGTIFSVVHPIWRVGECLCHAEDMARELGCEDAKVLFRVHWTGLQGRWLRMPNRISFFWEPRQWTSDETSVSKEVLVSSNKISDSLIEILRELLAPLYEKFDFYKVPIDLIQNETALMLSRRI